MAASKLFPTFMQHTGIDASKVNIKFIDPKLRETLLAEVDEVDAIIGQIFNTVLELKGEKGIEPDQGRLVPLIAITASISMATVSPHHRHSSRNILTP